MKKEANVASAPILIDPAVNQLADIDLFAAQIAVMYIVLTIDNSTAHLAAALGLPVWLLLLFAADWRWRELTTAASGIRRIFRQPEPGDWQSLIKNVLNALTSTTRPKA